MDREEEKNLVKKSRKDPAAFAALFEEYYAPIYRYVLYRAADPHAAADITAETFFKALNKINSFRFMGAPFSAWLYRIAGNEINTFFRKRKYVPASYEAFGDSGGLHEIASKEDIEEEFMEAERRIEENKEFKQVRGAMAGLSIKYQEVLVLRYIEGKKIEEISVITGKKQGTVKSLISRGVEKLKKTLDK